jgi:hypothetical protein
MNNLIRAQQSMPQVGQRDGNWVWNGSNWICDPGCDDGSGFPPFGPPVFSGPVNQPPWYPGANGGVSFGATAPPNPIRGHLWWNGLTLYLFDGAAWVFVGGQGAGGTVTPPSTAAPANPVPGQQWFNGTTLFVWDGNAWIPVSQTKTYIQATAPPAPNPGDTWWNGTQFFIWTGSAWENVGPGATVGPVPTTEVQFKIAAPTAITLPGTASAWNIVPLTASPSVDVQTGWTASTHKFQPKVAGQYLFGIFGFVSGPGGIALLKNDSGSFNSQVTDTVVAQQFNESGSSVLQSTAIASMNGTTDFVRLFASASDSTFAACGQNPVFDAWIFP